MEFYGLSTCDTCRKAQKALAAKGLGVTVIDVRRDGVAPGLLREFHAGFGEALINRRSTTWRNLDAAARGGDPVALLQAHPTLMKRPVIRAGGRLYLGWGRDVQAALLG